MLIKEEVILKRITSMDALAKGLEQLGIVTLLRNNPILAELYV